MRVRLFPLYVAMVAFALALAWSPAHAQAFKWYANANASYAGSASDVGAYCAIYAPATVNYYAGSMTGSNPSGLPTASGQAGTVYCTQEPNPTGYAAGVAASNSSFGMSSTACTSGCPVNPNNPGGTCPAGVTTNLVIPAAGTRTPAGGTVCGSDGCSYTANSLHTQLVVGAGGCTAASCNLLEIQKYQSAGSTCSPAASAPTPGPPIPAGTANSTCGTAGSVIACATTDTAGNQGATFNGDQVVPSQLPATGCVQFASGGVACVVPMGSVVPPVPPAPNNGTAGSTEAANPTGEVITGNSGSTPNQVDYYNSTTVNASKTPTASNGNGTTVQANGTAASGTGSGSGGSGTNGQDCDTSSNPAGCTGATPGAQTPECSSYSECLENFWSELQTAPIFSAVTALESAWPSGSCPTETVTLSTFSTAPGGGTFDYGTTMCNLWENDALPILSATTLVFFALVSVFIVLSA